MYKICINLDKYQKEAKIGGDACSMGSSHVQMIKCCL